MGTWKSGVFNDFIWQNATLILRHKILDPILIMKNNIEMILYITQNLTLVQ